MTIEAKNLLKIYGKRRVVNDVSLDVQRGEVVGLLGPNGAGKTTSFYMVVGLVKPNKGIITLDGKNISKHPMYKRARLGLGYLPQEPSVFRKLSVEQNILAIWQLRGGAPKLTLKDKISIAIRKRERSWWHREKYEKYYQNILNDIKTNEKEHDEKFSILGSELISKPGHESDQIYYLAKILELMELDFEEFKEEIIIFSSEFSKIYKQGRKKKLEGFLNQLWKTKRDKIYSVFSEENITKEEKINLLKSLLRVLNIENEITFEKVKSFPEINTLNNLIEFVNDLESSYWLHRKIPLLDNSEEINRIETLKKGSFENELNDFLNINNFTESEIKDIHESLTWTKRQSQSIQLEDILDEFNISHIRNSKGSDLSGGERRRVEIARAVANKPSFLLLDEPFAGIDPIAVAGIKEMIVLLKNRNIGVLITDHNVRETLKIIDRGYILSDGKVIEEGTREHLANSEVARKHYLGEDFSL